MATMTSAAPVEMSRLGRLHLSRVANEDEDPTLLKGINYPGKHDVMLGRGGESTYHCGNIAFRQLVEDHKNQYYNSPRAHKSRVVAEVVRKWRQLTPPGRFLTRSSPAEGDKSAWHDVGDRRALKKASHSLRDAVRCFSIEKKQREREQREGREFDDEDPTMPVSSEQCRKRSRVLEEEPEFMPSSFSARKHSSRGRRSFDDDSLEYIMTAAKKSSKIVIVRSEERPKKMRRVVCDEREESQEDCRRGGDEEDRRGGNDERCRGEERDCCTREEDCGGRQTVPSSVLLASPPVQLQAPLSTCPKQQERLDSNASPCGSAIWFSSCMADLPVRPTLSCVLPTADVLVQEVSSSESGASPLPAGGLSDEDSLGWFSEGEDDPAALFTATPAFHVSLHRPVANRNNNRGGASSGREL